MTNITITKKYDEIVKVVALGHTGYASEGEDIVCAAVSSVIQTAVLGLMQVAGVPIEFKQDEDIALMEIIIPELEDEDRHNANIILNTMLCGVTNLVENYGKFVKLNIKKS
ncbi:MAG: ribosomal-processing cysteine protease Prp [Firmicutes bacterium]|nr:ribosomal-processing cysteine protease Prp [Bacillota bacterium]MCL2255601.1 ribosomal-processing cysteine protease Prp [Bacillota bacterium]